nr:MAG TPA: nin one binding protein [Caudoviricetes sp.]
MPDEYISREAALKAANEWVSEACMAPVMRVSRLFDKLAKVPAADVAEVVQGSGKVRATEEAETTQIIDGCCTACGAFMDCIEAADYKFCPYCAKRVV